MESRLGVVRSGCDTDLGTAPFNVGCLTDGLDTKYLLVGIGQCMFFPLYYGEKNQVSCECVGKCMACDAITDAIISPPVVVGFLTTG